MKIQIRENVFETNSSSTHCIAFNLKKVNKLPSKLNINVDNFYEFNYNNPNERGMFLYLTFYRKGYKYFHQFNEILKNHNIEILFEGDNELTCYLEELIDFYLPFLDLFLDENNKLDEYKIINYIMNEDSIMPCYDNNAYDTYMKLKDQYDVFDRIDE